MSSPSGSRQWTRRPGRTDAGGRPFSALTRLARLARRQGQAVEDLAVEGRKDEFLDDQQLANVDSEVERGGCELIQQ